MYPMMQFLCRTGVLSSRLYKASTIAPSFSMVLQNMPQCATRSIRCLVTPVKTVASRSISMSLRSSSSFLPLFTRVTGRFEASICRRPILWMSTQRAAARSPKKSHTTVLIYISSMFVVMIGVAYAGVPLYRLFCAVCWTLPGYTGHLPRIVLLVLYLFNHQDMDAFMKLLLSRNYQEYFNKAFCACIREIQYCSFCLETMPLPILSTGHY